MVDDTGPELLLLLALSQSIGWELLQLELALESWIAAGIELDDRCHAAVTGSSPKSRHSVPAGVEP